MESTVPEEVGTVSVRYGEIGVNGSNVRKMEDVLRRNAEPVENRGVEDATVEALE